MKKKAAEFKDALKSTSITKGKFQLSFTRLKAWYKALDEIYDKVEEELKPAEDDEDVQEQWEELTEERDGFAKELASLKEAYTSKTNQQEAAPQPEAGAAQIKCRRTRQTSNCSLCHWKN